MKFKRVALVLAVLTAGAVQAQTWKVDFQGNGTSGGLFGQAGPFDMTEEPNIVWNKFAVKSFESNPQTVFTDDPNMILVDIGGINPIHLGLLTTGVAGTGLLAWDGTNSANPLQTDYLLLFNAVGAGTGVIGFEISRLAPNTEYVLTYHHGTNSPAVRSLQFVANGVITDVGGTADITETALVTSNADGKISGTATNTGNEGNWAGLEITVAINPIIETNPIGQLVDLGDTAQFTISALDPSGGTLTYQWFLDPNTAGTGDEIALTDGGDISGATSDTLTIANVEQGDEGVYYCEVTNASATVSSDRVNLRLKACLYHWPLDGDGIEANGTGFDGALEGGAVFVVGGGGDPNARVGTGSVSTDGIDGILRIVPNDTPLTNSEEITISFWVNPSNIGADWDSMVSRFNSAFWIGQANVDGRIRTATFNGGGENPLDSDPHPVTGDEALSNGEWTFVTYTHASDGTVSIFVNGELDDNEDSGGVFANGSGPLLIGAFTVDDGATAQNHFAGRVDDLKIYNYAFTTAEVAQAYYDVTGVTVCLRDPEDPDVSSLGITDINIDCKIDLFDFGLMAGVWLDCNLIPQSACQ